MFTLFGSHVDTALGETLPKAVWCCDSWCDWGVCFGCFLLWSWKQIRLIQHWHIYRIVQGQDAALNEPWINCMLGIRWTALMFDLYLYCIHLYTKIVVTYWHSAVSTSSLPLQWITRPRRWQLIWSIVQRSISVAKTCCHGWLDERQRQEHGETGVRRNGITHWGCCGATHYVNKKPTGVVKESFSGSNTW